MGTKLMLIRHGQTEWNLHKRYSGFIDLRINQAGKYQAARLAGYLKRETVDKVYSSDRRRAIQTAKIIFAKKKIEKISGLKEMHFGVFEGNTYKQNMKKFPAIYKKWLDDPFGTAIPKGEHMRDFQKRVVGAMKKIVSQNKGKTIAVVFHGGSISIFINYILKSRDFWKWIPKDASLSIVEYKNSRPKVRLFGEIFYN